MSHYINNLFDYTKYMSNLLLKWLLPTKYKYIYKFYTTVSNYLETWVILGYNLYTFC